MQETDAAAPAKVSTGGVLALSSALADASSYRRGSQRSVRSPAADAEDDDEYESGTEEGRSATERAASPSSARGACEASP